MDLKKSAFIITVSLISCYPSAANATCTVPNVLTNGEVADASQVMDNFDAVADCADAAASNSVTTTGAPPIGSLPVFSGPKTITSGNLTGDVTTSGGTAATLANSGVTPGTYTNANITVDAKGRVTVAGNGSGSGGGGRPATLPSSATFSNILNGPTISNGLYSLKLTTTGAVGLQGLYNAAPALPFSAVMKVKGGVLTDFNSMGFIVGDSAGRFVTVNVAAIDSLVSAVEQWTAFNSFESGFASTNLARGDVPPWLKIDVDSNGDVAGYWSFTGDNPVYPLDACTELCH